MTARHSTRIGIIGAGQIVENAHLPVLLNLADTTVRWVSDTNVERARVLTKMFRVPAIEPDRLEPMLDDVDACLIATPVGAREHYLAACERRGIAVLTEKPFAISEAAHRDLCSRFPAHALGAAFQRRFYRSVAAAREIIEQRPFGALERIDFSIGGFDLKSGGPRSYLGNPQLSGGGVVMDLGVHVLDQVLVATSASDVAVEQVKSIALDGIDYDVTVASTLRTAHGPVPVHGQLTRLRPLRSGMRLVFADATVSFGIGPEGLPVATPRAGGSPIELGVRATGAVTTNQAFFTLWRTFLDGMARRETSAASAATSILTSRWVDAIYAGILP